MITFGSDVGDLILQRTLSENTLGLNFAIERMTSGYRVNHAKDNAAGYSIITDLNTKISSMLQVQQNAEDGLDMLQTAGGGLEEIQKLFERLRALAEQASNDSYGAASREAMQREADEIIEEIERIKNTIEYNGMKLYETPNDNAVTTSVNRLLASTKVSNAGEIYPKKHNDTQKSPAAFTSAVGGGDNIQSSSSSVSLLSSNALEGSEAFGANETKIITIDGVDYTITNRQNIASNISYTKDDSTGEITFMGNYFTIRGQQDKEHNLIINGSYNYVYGGDLNDKISDINGQTQNFLYGGNGDDILTLNTSRGKVYGEAGNDIITAGSTSIYAPNSSFDGGSGDNIININQYYISSIKVGDGNNTFNINTNCVAFIQGGAGDDTFNINASYSSVKIDGKGGTNVVNGNISDSLIVNAVNANGGVVDLAANESKDAVINGANYNFTAKQNACTIYYKLNDDGSISFSSTVNGIIIRAQKDKSHFIRINSNLIFYGGDMGDNIIANAGVIYGGQGNDTITGQEATIYGGGGVNNLTMNSHGMVYSSSDNDTITVNSSFNYINITGNNTSVTLNGQQNNVHSMGQNNVLVDNNADNFYSGFGDIDNAEAVLLNPSETKDIIIDGVKYTVRNSSSHANSLLYSKNGATGQILFAIHLLHITGQADVQHNVVTYGDFGSFTGGNLDDTIESKGWRASINGLGGNDILILRSGDEAYGGTGDDILYTYSGIAYGQEGNDTLYIYNTGKGNGGVGDDTYYIYTDTAQTDEGGNNIYNINTDGANISGSNGNDTFYVNGNNNTVLGGGGDDYFIIDGNNNTIDGGTDNNTYINNGSGTNMSNVNRDPNAGSLSFTSNGETKTFTLNGKTYTVTNNLSGSNTLQYSLNPNTGVITVNGSSFEISADTNEAAILNIRGNNNIINGSSLDDRIIIEQGSNNTINGLDGNDALSSNSSNNSLLGGLGNDTINLNASTNLKIDGGDGNDILNITSDNNTNIIAGSGNNTLNISGSNNTVTASDGNNIISAGGSGNTVNLGEGNNKITVNGSQNTITGGSGKNTLGIQGNLNNITLDNTSDEINIYGDNNTIAANNGENDVIIRGNGNHFTTQNGNKDVNVRGDNNTIQTGAGNDDIRINGNDNKVFGGDSDDNFTVTNGNNNTIDGEGGNRNTLIDNGNNTQINNAVIITPSDFEVNIKVDIGSGDDKFIKTQISFNLLGFSVDFSSSESARESLETIDDMLKNVNEQLLNIGTTINRLESVLEAQSSKLENLISFRSTMRDADIAEESSNFIKYQILQQASATLMAASRNLRAENVLGLLGNINQG